MAEEAVTTGGAAVSEEPERAADRLAEDLARLREDLRRLTEHLGEEGAERLGRVRDAAQTRLAELEKAVEELRRRARELRPDVTGGLERTVREQPLLSLLAAFGVGVLIGRLLGR